MENNISREKWIDVAKAVAIIGVIIDHSREKLYTNEAISFFSYYDVCLFILLMGITFIKYSKGTVSKTVISRCVGIIAPYVVASFVYCICIYKAFDLEVFLGHLIRFNMSGPFYYVLLYIQLVLVSPILVYALDYAQKKSFTHFYEIAVFVVVVIVSVATTNHTNILNVYGGGGKLFGGSYLILLYLGMLFGKYYSKINFKTITVIVLSVISLVASLACWRFISVNKFAIDRIFPFKESLNPPGVSLMIYAIFIMVTVFLIGKLIQSNKNNNHMMIWNGMSIIGRHTLYIFLYHRLFLDFIFPQLNVYGVILGNIWVKRLLYPVLMIVGSMCIEFLLKKINVIKKLIDYSHGR